MKKTTKASSRDAKLTRKESESTEIEATNKKAPSDYTRLQVLQCMRTAAGKRVDNPEIESMLERGAVEMYLGLKPQDSLQGGLAMLYVALQNSVMDCMADANRLPFEAIGARELLLRLGFRGAREVANLAETLEKVRGNPSGSRVNVGKVNVESGGQAIVGNVNAERRSKKSEPAPGEPPSKKPKAAKV